MIEDKQQYIKNKINELINIVNELESVFPGRKFTLDGHLLGSIGEVLAEHYYNIKLYPNSTKLHDGIVDDKEVQIKITQIGSVDISGKPSYLLVLFLDKINGEIFEVYNGPGDIVLKNAKATKNGWYTRQISTLSKLDKSVEETDRIKACVKINKWSKSIYNPKNI